MDLNRFLTLFLSFLETSLCGIKDQSVQALAWSGDGNFNPRDRDLVGIEGLWCPASRPSFGLFAEVQRDYFCLSPPP